jgi:hypothetical protein
MWSCCYMGTGKQLGLCYLWLWIPVNIQSISFIRYKPRCFGYSILLDAAIRVLDYLNIYFVLYRKAVQLPLPSYWHSCQLFFLKVLLNEFMIYAFHFIVMCNVCQVRNSTTILTKEFIDSLPNGWEEYAWRRINKGIQL